MKIKSLVLFTVTAAVLSMAPPAQAVIDGLPDNTETAVVSIFFGTSTDTCTGMLIEPTVVLTSGSCIKEAYDNNDITTGRVLFGPDESSPTEVINVIEGIYHRRLNATTFNWDVGLLLLETPAAPAPVVLHTGPFPEEVLGNTLRIVGFGANVFESPNYLGGGIKRSADLIVTIIGNVWIKAGDDMNNACKGDTGAPLYYDFDPSPDTTDDKVVAISAETTFCYIGGGTKKTRLDVVYDSFVVIATDLWVGACVPDGTCVTNNCRSPDPDCDVTNCLADGVCNLNCDIPDWDCPIGLDFDAECTDKFDCESRVCVTAPDDNRIKYCSNTCTPATVDTDCQTDMDCINNECVFTAPTRGAQGALCSNAPCRSGLACHPDGYCVESCADANAVCAQDSAAAVCGASISYACQPSSLGSDFACACPVVTSSDFCTISLDTKSSRHAQGILLLFGLTILGYAVARSRR